MNFDKKNLQKKLSYLLILIPMIGFWYIFQKYALNLPHWDDYAVKHTVLKINESDSFTEKISLFFAQHNEHRIFLTRFFGFIIFKIKGEIDFKWLMILGNLALFGILFLFYKISKKYNLSLLAFVPLSFILLTIGLYENTFWGMASVQNFWVIFLAFLSFYFLSLKDENSNKWLLFSILFSFLGIFTSSNGILIFIIGALVLVFQQRFKAFFIWISSSIIFLITYFYTYQKPTDTATKIVFSDWKLYLKGLLLSLGSAVEMYKNTISKEDFSMALGVFLMIFIGLFTYQVIFKKYNLEKRNLDFFLLACIAFIGITCFGIAISRSSYGLGVLLTSKYKIYSVLLLMIFYLVSVSSLAGKSQNRFIKIGIIASIFYNIYTFHLNLDNIRFQHQERICDDFNSKIHNNSKIQIDSKILDSLKITEKKEVVFFERKETFVIDFSLPKNAFYIVLNSENNTYQFPTKPIWNSKKDFFALNRFLGNKVKFNGFETEISKIGIKTGKYQVFWQIVENDRKVLYSANQSIDIQEVTLNNSKQNW